MSEDKKKDDTLAVFRDMDKKSILALLVTMFLVQRLLFQNLVYTAVAVVLVIVTSFCVVTYESWRLRNRRAPNPGFLV